MGKNSAIYSVCLKLFQSFCFYLINLAIRLLLHYFDNCYCHLLLSEKKYRFNQLLYYSIINGMDYRNQQQLFRSSQQYMLIEMAGKFLVLYTSWRASWYLIVLIYYTNQACDLFMNL